MITLLCAFGLFTLMFAIIGALRGPGKEVIVSFSVIVAIAFIVLVEDLLPLTSNLFKGNTITQYWFRTITVLLMVLFGYITPKVSSISKVGSKPSGFQDYLLGFFLGIFNAYLIVGTLWYYMDAAGYPFPQYISPPTGDTQAALYAQELVKLMPPAFLYGYRVIAAVVIVFVFVIIVMI